MSLLDFMLKMPTHMIVTLSRERDEDDGEFFLCATVTEKPPEGGWETGCEYFGHVPGLHGEDAPCGWRKPVPQWAHDNGGCCWSVTAATVEDLESLLRNMMDKRFSEKGHEEREID